ncbi:MAG: sirohydrochlorin chelatase [Chloroflexaceae bacterium]|nr:sirohydrochlorin chelatase [Chloroflexaceae bacterium]
MAHHPFDQLLLIGHGSPSSVGNNEYLAFTQSLAEHLGLPVQPCFLELAEPSIEAGIEACISNGAQQIAVLPLFLGAAGHYKEHVPAVLSAMGERHAGMTLAYGRSIGVQPALLSALHERASEMLAASVLDASPAATAVIVTARGSSDAQNNAEIFRLARLLWEMQQQGLVEVAFQSVTWLTVEQAIERCQRLGASCIVVVPYLLFSGFVRSDIERQVAVARASLNNATEILVARHLFGHAGLVEAVAQRYAELVDAQQHGQWHEAHHFLSLDAFAGDFHGHEHHHHHGHGHGHGHHHHDEAQ